MEMLNDLHGIEAWFVTRFRLDEWIVTHLRGNAPFERGHALTIPAATREAMLRGQRYKEQAEVELEAVAVRTAADRSPGEPAFVGAPLVVGDQLFGVLCGVDTSSKLTAAHGDSPHVMTAARILSTILRSELEREELLRRAERAEDDALIDELTGLFNRRGWDRLTEREETRSARYGHSATVFMMDVDGLKQKNDAEGHTAARRRAPPRRRCDAQRRPRTRRGGTLGRRRVRGLGGGKRRSAVERPAPAARGSRLPQPACSSRSAAPTATYAMAASPTPSTGPTRPCMGARPPGRVEATRV